MMMIKARRIKQAEHVARSLWERWEMHTKFYFIPEEKGPLGRWEVNIKIDHATGMWTGSNWLRIRQSGGLLCTQQWTLWFHKRRRIPLLPEWLLASQEGICSTEFVSGQDSNPCLFSGRDSNPYLCI
jgi:hypothetical protein